MKRTQVQLPDRLYAEVKRVAELHEWSVSEVIRRGAEYIVRCYPAGADDPGWVLPEPLDLGPFLEPCAEWRALAEVPEERL